MSANPDGHRQFDVIVAGASFAGLAASQRVRGRIALIDKSPLGDGVTSACGAPVAIVRAMGAAASIQQVHEQLVIHTPTRRAVWPLPEPFCTFEYRRFCELAFARTSATSLQATVHGRTGSTVHTSAGDLSARFLVDATGWRAVLAGGPQAPYVNRRWMAFGLETEVVSDLEPGLHFYFLPEVRDGYAWAFPCGPGIRFGVLSYRGRSNLAPVLRTFLGRFGLKDGGLHGGFLASGLREPVIDGVFVVGDAAGQCLPLSGEGIRTAVLAGWRAGDLIQQVRDGEISRQEAHRHYRDLVTRSRRKYRALLWGNIALLTMPASVKARLAGWLSRPAALSVFMPHYLRIFSGGRPALDRSPHAEGLSVLWGGGSCGGLSLGRSWMPNPVTSNPSKVTNSRS